MANKEYTITAENGIETTVLLSDEDAKARGLTGGKAVDPADMQADPSDKGFAAANKAASPANKPAKQADK